MEAKKIKKIEKITRGRFMVSAAAAGVSGDAAVTCGLPDGSLAFILSDGMGNGMKAAAESQAVITRLRKFLKDGMPPAKAIKAVNRYMIEQSGEEEIFATVDLTIIDKKSEKAKFYKMGAATSFLVRDGSVKRVEQPALPVGIIPRVKLTHVCMGLLPGDIVVMVSDGITEADRSDLAAAWLENYLESDMTGKGPRALAGEIVAMAQSRYGKRQPDDLTAVVAMIE